MNSGGGMGGSSQSIIYGERGGWVVLVKAIIRGKGWVLFSHPWVFETGTRYRIFAAGGVCFQVLVRMGWQVQLGKLGTGSIVSGGRPQI